MYCHCYLWKDSDRTHLNNCPDGQAGLGVRLESQEWMVRFPAETYFHLEFFAFSPSLQLDGTLSNEIKRDYSPVFVSDPKYD